MYAIVQTGGKQYRVQPGDVIHIEKLAGTRGTAVEFNDVLMIVDESGAVTVGTPQIPNARVSGEIRRQSKARKVIIFKHRRRKGYRKKTGHRQPLTEVKITDITVA